LIADNGLTRNSGFSEEMPARFDEKCKEDFPKCDLLIVMGTSLNVHPFSQLIELPPAGVPRLLINRERVGEYPYGGFEFDKVGTQDVLYLGDCDDGCVALARQLGWENDLKALCGVRL
jgi:NAD-dependent deacetylase sirtuin 2